MEAVAPKRSLFGPDYVLLAGLVLVSLGIHVWLVSHTKVTARDSIGFARYALRIQSPESSNPEKPADRRRLKVDVIREAEQPPGYPIAVWVAAKVVRRTMVPERPDGLWSSTQLAESTLLATQIANAIAALLLVVPTYLIGRMLFSRSVGFSAALLFQVLPVSARITSDGLSEGVYLLAVATSLCSSQTSWSVRMFLAYCSFSTDWMDDAEPTAMASCSGTESSVSISRGGGPKRRP